MGGLAIPDSGGPWLRRQAAIGPRQQIVISLAGPVFGFLLAGLLAGIVLAIGGNLHFDVQGIIPLVLPELPGELFAGPLHQAVWMIFTLGIWTNIFLNVLNLAPVYPLDGGQIARQIFVLNDPWRGVLYSLWLSVFVGAVIAFTSFQQGDQFIGFFFAILAWMNYMTVRQAGGYGGGYGGRPW
jgi:Zn-dependent protease